MLNLGQGGKVSTIHMLFSCKYENSYKSLKDISAIPATRTLMLKLKNFPPKIKKQFQILVLDNIFGGQHPSWIYLLGWLKTCYARQISSCQAKYIEMSELSKHLLSWISGSSDISSIVHPYQTSLFENIIEDFVQQLCTYALVYSNLTCL